MTDSLMLELNAMPRIMNVSLQDLMTISHFIFPCVACEGGVIKQFFFIDAKICPSSLAAYLDSLGLVVSEEKVRLQEKILYSVPSPKFGPTDVERAEEIFDWIGSLAFRESRYRALPH